MSSLESCHSLRASFISGVAQWNPNSNGDFHSAVGQQHTKAIQPSLDCSGNKNKAGNWALGGKWGSFRPAAYSGQHEAQQAGEGGLSPMTAPGCSSLWLVLCLGKLCPRQAMPFLIVFKLKCDLKWIKFGICWILRARFVPSAWPGLPSHTLVQRDDPIPPALPWVTSGKGFPHHHRFIYLFIVLSVANVVCLDGHRSEVVLMEQWYLWVRGKENKDGFRLLARTQCWNCNWAGHKGGWYPSHSANLDCWPPLLISASCLLRKSCSFKKLIITSFSGKKIKGIKHLKCAFHLP